MSKPKIFSTQHYYDLPLSGLAELDKEKVFFDFTHNWYSNIIKFKDLQYYLDGSIISKSTTKELVISLPQEVKDKLSDYQLPSNEEMTQIKTEDYRIFIDGSCKEIHIEGRERYNLYRLSEQQLFELERNKSEEY